MAKKPAAVETPTETLYTGDGTAERTIITASPVKKIGRFEFATRIAPELPKIELARGARQPAENPFTDFFDTKIDRAERFIPTEYWLASPEQGGKGTNPRFEAGNKKGQLRPMLAHAQQKIRDAFRTWQDKNDKGKNWALILVPRKAGSSNGEFPDEGVSMFLVEKKPEAKPEAEQA